MKATIVIATWNRPELLRETLESLDRSLSGVSPVTTVVVHPPDDAVSPQAAQSVSVAHLNLSIVTEKERGLSAARNRGIREAEGDVVVFLDDDVEVAPGWLPALLEPFSDPSVQVVGGRVLPFGVALPDWLPVRFYGFVSIYDKGDKPAKVDDIIGCSFAVRKDCFARVGMFNSALGRREGMLLGNEEVDFCGRLGPGQIAYAPQAVVYHKIGARLQLAYIRRISRMQGVSDARMALQSPAKFALGAGKAVGKLALSTQLIVAPFLPRQRKTTWIIRRNYSWGFLTWWLKRHFRA